MGKASRRKKERAADLTERKRTVLEIDSDDLGDPTKVTAADHLPGAWCGPGGQDFSVRDVMLDFAESMEVGRTYCTICETHWRGEEPRIGVVPAQYPSLWGLKPGALIGYYLCPSCLTASDQELGDSIVKHMNEDPSVKAVGQDESGQDDEPKCQVCAQPVSVEADSDNPNLICAKCAFDQPATFKDVIVATVDKTRVPGLTPFVRCAELIGPTRVRIHLSWIDSDLEDSPAGALEFRS